MNNMFEFFSQPSQMVFWSNPKNLVDFLRVQAYFHEIGASPHVSKAAKILEECASEICKLYHIEEYEPNVVRRKYERPDGNLSESMGSEDFGREEESIKRSD